MRVKRYFEYLNDTTYLNNNAASAVSLPRPAHSRWGSDGREVSVDPNVGQVIPQPPNPGAGDQLTIVELDPLEVVARNQVVQTGVRDQGQIVKLQDCEMF